MNKEWEFRISNNSSYSLAQPTSTSSSCARSVCGFYVTSLSFNKEVTKKMNSDVPSEASLRLPRYTEEQERSNKRFQCCAPSLATTRGRRRRQKPKIFYKKERPIAPSRSLS